MARKTVEIVPTPAGLSGYVAELASGFILADLGIAHNPREDHAAYIASWLSILKSDPRAIFTAASKAQAIADWMHAQQPTPLRETSEGACAPAHTAQISA
jgi:antirestriction protein ArdC